MKKFRILFLASAVLMMVPSCSGAADKADEAASELDEAATEVAEDAAEALEEAEEVAGDALGSDLSDEEVDQLLND